MTRPAWGQWAGGGGRGRFGGRRLERSRGGVAGVSRAGWAGLGSGGPEARSGRSPLQDPGVQRCHRNGPSAAPPARRDGSGWCGRRAAAAGKEAHRLSWGSPERRPPYPPKTKSQTPEVCLETCVMRSQRWASGWGWGCVRIGNIGRAWLLREKWGSILEKVAKVSGPSGSVEGL